MLINKQSKSKEGAASFYVVIFATLILMVVVISFAAIIASEMTKSSNDDLSQSAYDSALAGVEDAKLAYYNYQNCLSNDSRDDNCLSIINAMKNKECDMVGKMLGKEDNNQEVTETNTGNNMQQEYTCVKIEDQLNDYRSTLSSSETTRVVKVKFDQADTANNIEKVKISWYIQDDSIGYSFSSPFSNLAPTPPVISLSLLQTSDNFVLSDFDVTKGFQTNRGTIFLVPAKNGITEISAKEGFLKSNDKTSKNNPFLVNCSDDEDGGEFLCSATVEIPKPIGDNRNPDTFAFVVGLPYGKPTTDFSLEFYCDEGTNCNTKTTGGITGETDTASSIATLKGVQVDIDSTGRANDLYRRVNVRLEDSSGYTLSTFGALKLLSSSSSGSSDTGSGDGGSIGGRNDHSIDKNLEVTSEYNF